jgi:hypothetical protein
VQDSEVVDSRTRLIWQRAVPSQTFTWQQAMDFCPTLGNGYRLPTVLELYSLVDVATTSVPRIDLTAFPDTGIQQFWTSTMDLADFREIVWFATAGIFSTTAEQALSVRCVR